HSIPANHSHRLPGALAPESARAGAVSPYARAFRVFLRMLAFFDLDRPRQIFRLARNGSRHPEAAVYHGGNAGAAAEAAAGDYVYCGMGAAAWFQEMAAAASPDLFRGARGSDSLLLAGQVRHP